MMQRWGSDPSDRLERATTEDVAILREIAILSKAHWGYDADFLNRFSAILGISDSYLLNNYVCVARRGSTQLGWCSLTAIDPRGSTDHTAASTSREAILSPEPAVVPRFQPNADFSSARANENERAVLLDDLWVLPRAIGIGLGRALLEAALRTAAEMGAAEMRLDSDPNAVGFYEYFGFRIIDEQDGGLGRKIPHMVRIL